MKLSFLLSLLLLTTSVHADVLDLTTKLLENTSEMTSIQTSSAVDTLSPHYLVYGFEVSKSVGVGDVLEVGGAFGVEFHYEKVEGP